MRGHCGRGIGRFYEDIALGSATASGLDGELGGPGGRLFEVKAPRRVLHWLGSQLPTRHTIHGHAG